DYYCSSYASSSAFIF
nr:immunoglobulin light chain junction region [Macaca mulatta]MOW71850.1 immunoglobulin light chain junction region [Macaca mulatta]